MDAIEINNFIADYFGVGLQQNEIVAMLAMKHDFVISSRPFKKISRRFGFRRLMNYSQFMISKLYLKCVVDLYPVA